MAYAVDEHCLTACVSDNTIEDDSQISEPDRAERAIDLPRSRGDFEIDHAFFRYPK